MKLITLLVAAALAQAPAAPAPAPRTVVVFETGAGAITIEVNAEKAPVTAANFLKYVDADVYDGSRFFRIVRPDNETRKDMPIAVIVADLDPSQAGAKRPPIALERTSVTGLKHVDGAVSMGRLQAVDSADTEFFISIGDQPSLDFGGRRNPDGQGYAVFGRVIAGMDVVRKIWQAPAEGQQLKPVVRIERAYRR